MDPDSGIILLFMRGRIFAYFKQYAVNLYHNIAPLKIQ